jgi:hypothetical protein
LDDQHGREVEKKIIIVMGVMWVCACLLAVDHVCVLALELLASPLALSSVVIPKKWLRLFISRRIGPSYRNTIGLFEKVEMFELFDCC